MAGETILVTGGAGYVGSHTVDLLVRRGHDVVVFDDLSTGHRAAVPPGVPLVVGSTASPADLERAFAGRGISTVMHFAALSLTGESMKQPVDYLRANTVGALNLIEAAVRHGSTRFVLSSTANLFDAAGEAPISEDCEVTPGSPYGESKFFAERSLHWASRLHGVRVACLRYFNAAGADPSGARGEHHDPETHLVPLVLQTALGQRPHVEIFGTDYPTRDGTCVRDYVHVLDLAEAHLLVLDALEDRSFLQYNLGTREGHSVKEVIEVARHVTGHDIPAVTAERRPGDPPALVASSERIRRELGWAPRYADLRSIVETAWAWHSAHPNGYQD